MPHSSFKKTSVAFLVAALVAVNVTQVETVFAESVYALDEAKTDSGLLGKKISDARDLVALIVDQDVWNDSNSYDGLAGKYGGVSSDDLRSRVERYAEDVQKALPKTQVMILPVTQEPQSVLKVQQVLERLYLEGDPENSSPTQLKGVVIVGEVPLPVVHKGSQFFMSLLPYTDFVDPEYVFSSSTQTFERVSGVTGAKPEAWHGVIRPPLSGIDGRRQLAEYFDKNHLYHSGDKAFTDFQKKVLVSDLHGEAKSLNSSLFPRYENFLKNMEDLAYNRYSAKWLAVLKKTFDLASANNIAGVNAGVGALAKETAANSEVQKTAEEKATAAKNAQEVSAAKQQIAQAIAGKGAGAGTFGAMNYDPTIPDIQTVKPIQKYHVQYPELFGTFLNTITDWVAGSGRWSAEDVETIPALIAKKDLFTMQYLKSINDSLEVKIDDQVEKIQQPQRLNRNVTVEGHVADASGKPVTVGLPILDQLGNTLSSVLLFINNSQMQPSVYGQGSNKYSIQVSGKEFGKSLQYKNGINFDDLTHVQQCTLYGGTQQPSTSGTGAVSQMVKFLRAFNLGTLNTSAVAQSTGGGFSDPRYAPAFGFHTRALSSAEAQKETGGQYTYGARIEPDVTLGIPAFYPGWQGELQLHDIILRVDGKQISQTRSVESVVKAKYPIGTMDVEYWRKGFPAPKTIKLAGPDANADTLVAGCYGINSQSPQKCFPEAATRPIADRAGTARISDTVTILDADGMNACTNFSSFGLFDQFLHGIPSQAIPGVYKILDAMRTNPNSNATPPENSHDPAKIFLSEGYSMQQLLNQYGLMNGRDDNSDHFDTNGNGKIDKMAWSDMNKNGKLDLWLKDNFLEHNAYKHPGENQANNFENLPTSLTPEEFRVIHPELFNGNQYTGAYTGEFVGGDWGIDDPGESSSAFVTVGATEEERWRQIQKAFFDIDQVQVYATTRTQRTKKEYRAFLEAKAKSAGQNFGIKPYIKMYVNDPCVEFGGTFCADDTLEAEQLLQGTASTWLKFTPNKAKDLSTAAFHKEPTTATLRSQFQSALSTGLPIDKPRYVSYANAQGSVQKVVYPNIFTASSLEEYLTQLKTMEQTLGMGEGALTSVFTNNAGLNEGIKTLANGESVFTLIDSKKVQSFVDWKGLSAEAKHQRVMEEYLNPAIDGYIDDANGAGAGTSGAMGYEALYFVADGKPTYYTTNFSGAPPLNETDPVYLSLTSGTTVFGDSGANSGSNGAGKGKPAASDSVDSVPSNGPFYNEPVPLFEWFGAMKLWWKDTKEAFKKPLGLDLSKAFDGNTFNKTVNPGAVAKSLSMVFSKPQLQTRGDSLEIVITAKDASGKIASGDHTSAVRIEVSGNGNAAPEGAMVVPDVQNLASITFQNGTKQKGIFLSDGVAKFQIVSGNKPQTLVVRAYAYSEQGQIQSESRTIVVSAGGAGSLNPNLFDIGDVSESGTPKTLVMTSESGGSNGLLIPGGTTSTNMKVDMKDDKNLVIKDQIIHYTVNVSGPIEVANVVDADPKAAGVQIDAYADSLVFAVRSKTGKETGTGTVQVIGTLSDGTTLQTSGAVTVRSDIHLELSANVASLSADGGSQAIFTGVLKDGSGGIVNYSGPASFTLGNKDMGTVVSTTSSYFVNGKATVAVRAGTRAGTLTMYADALGLPSVSASITLLPLPASALRVTSSVKTMPTKTTSASGTTNVSVSLFDPHGNLVTGGGSVPIQVRITKDTQKYGFLKTSNGGLTNQITIYPSQGTAVVTVASRETPGPIHLVFSANGVSSDAFEIVTHGRTGVGQVANFSPNVLYASVLGGPFGNVTQQNYLAGNFLFSGKTQAASAVTTESVPNHRMMSLNAYGGIQVTDESVSLQVAASGEQEPLRVDVMNGLNKAKIGSVIVKQQAQPQLVSSLDGVGVSGKAGIFVQNLQAQDSLSPDQDVSAITFTSGASGLILREREHQIARVNTAGGIQVNDSRVALRITDVGPDVTDGPGDVSTYLRVDILFSGAMIARVQLGFDAVNSIQLQHAMPSMANLPNGIWLVSHLQDGDIGFQQSYSNYSTSDASGYALVNFMKDSLESDDTLGESYSSLEDALKTPGVGFAGDNKHMLLLAARNTVGESHLPYSSEIGIVLGDPTVTLVGQNPHSETGFTKDLGKSIYSGTASAQVILPIDVQGDGKKDLLIGTADGRVQYLQYVGGQQRYADRGLLIDVANGIRTGVVGDINHDGFEDVLFGVQENCTTKDTCVDLYRNNGGFFSRENLGLAIDPSVKITSMQLADMNQDSWLDLVVALTNGDVRVFTNQQGVFAKFGQTVGTLDVTKDGEIQLLISAKLPGVEKLGAGTGAGAGPGTSGAIDAMPDILAKGSSGKATAVYFLSKAPVGSAPGGNITYTKVDAPAQPDQASSIETLETGLENANKPKNVSDAMKQALGALGATGQGLGVASDMQKLYTDANSQDSNGNGVPDYADMAQSKIGDYLSSIKSGGVNGITESVTNTIKGLRCGEACFPQPINQAFLVPGVKNNNGVPAGFEDGVPVFGAAGTCYPWPFWPYCSFKDPAMSFRIYVSPTLTGQVGFAICSGGPYPTATCYAFAPNISLIPASICKAVSQKMSAIVGQANAFGASVADKIGGDGHTVAIANGGASFNGTTDTSNTHEVSNLLSPYKAETNVATNIRVPGFPQFLTDWLDKQIEEVLDKLADLPDLYVMYPSLSSIGSSFVPKVPKGKLSGYTKFLAYLNSIPLISIDPKPVSIRVPSLSPSQILKFKNDYESWGVDFKSEIDRVKGVLQCSKGPANPGTLEVCQLIDIRAAASFKKIQNIFQGLDKLKELPKKILDYRMIETKYVKQLINYLRTVSTFIGGYVKRQETRLAQWLDIGKQIKGTLAQWQGLVDITADYNAQCDSCKSERFSLFHVLTQLFVNIPSPPVIQFPKWPDIVLDFSRVETGVRVSWPDVTFTPQQILLPTLPRVRLPMVNIENPATLKADLSVLKADLNIFFEDLLPTIPEIPNIPDLPNLPDLPPLPVFKLPDLPPAPKIPGLDMVKGVNIQKHLTVLKDALQVICLLKKGYITVPEYNLKTQIEELTQRSLKPPLDIDLQAGLNVKYPSIEYDSVDQFVVRGKMKFELQTDFIYDFFKQFADSANAVTTDLVKGTNKATTNASKSAQQILDQASRGEYRMVAETSYVNVKDLPEVDVGVHEKMDAPSNDTYISGLTHALERYLADRSSVSGGISAIGDAGEQYSRQWLAEYGASSMHTYLAQAGTGFAEGTKRYLAYTEGSSNPPPGATSGSASASAESDALYQQYADATQTPLGMYIHNPKTGSAEKLIAYSLEMSRDPKEIGVDIDADGDMDSIYSFGGDVYVKENQVASPSGAFYETITKNPRVATINDLLPILPAVHGIQTDYSQKQSVTVTWNEVSGASGYELFFRDAYGTARKRFLYEDAAGKIPYDPSVTVDALPRSTGTGAGARGAITVSFPLEYGTTFFQVTPLNATGQAGTTSGVGLLAPQLCGNASPPLTSAGPHERFVAISKTLSVDASSSLDAKSSIAEYFVDTDTLVDANKDGDATNDRNITQDTPIFTIGPFTKEQTVGIKVWSENAQGIRSSQAITVHVFVPDITLSDASLNPGTAYGHVTPVVPQMPFALVRQRAGSATVLGDYTTDDQGNFLVQGLSSEGKTVVKNAQGEIVAEYSEATGKVLITKPGYTLKADTNNLNHLILVRVQDAKGTTLASFFQVPDSNTDAVIDPSSFTYTPVTVSTLHGVHVQDTNPQDTYIFRTIAANDPKFFGGVEVIDTTSAKRIAVIDSAGHTYLLNANMPLGIKDIPDMPYLFDLKLGNVPLGHIYIASVYGKPVTVLDSKDFEATPIFGLPSDKPSTTIFSDVSVDSPIFDSVVILEQNNIIEGYQENGKTVFKPGQLISRAEYTKIVLTALCIEPRAEAYKAPSTFSDIAFTEPTPWYYPWIKESYLLNLITGYLGEKNSAGVAPFKPLAYISRAESAKILLEALKMLKIIDLSSIVADTTQPWYTPYLKVGQNLKPYLKNTSNIPLPYIVTPQESSTPDYQMTRGDFAVMAARVLKFSNCHPPVKPVEPVITPATDGPNKTSQLPPGVYVYLPPCQICPCVSTLDNTGKLLPGDTIFAILSSKDHTQIYRKSNAVLLSPSKTLSSP